MIDLRPPGEGHGWAVVATPERELDMGVYLGTDPHEVNPALVAAFRDALGFAPNPRIVTLANLLAGVLIDEARTDGTRHRPLRPRSALVDGRLTHRWEIYLGNEMIWQKDVPVIAGGATISESFNKADSSTIGPNLTWVKRFGTWSVESNHLHVHADTNEARVVADAPLATDDHFAQIEVLNASGSDVEGGVMLRASTVSKGDYYEVVLEPFDDTTRWQKRVSDTVTSFGIVTLNTNVASPFTIKASVTGSTLRLYYNGTLYQTLTDTSVIDIRTTGVIAAFPDPVPNSSMFDYDNFTAADISSEKVLSGTLGAKGALTKSLGRIFVGSSSPTGVLAATRVVLQAFAGSLQPLGALQRSLIRAFAGSTQPSGVFTKRANKVLASSLRPTGTFVKLYLKRLGGAITASGVLELDFLGRVIGRPGIVAMALRKAADVRSRVRKG